MTVAQVPACPDGVQLRCPVPVCPDGMGKLLAVVDPGRVRIVDGWAVEIACGNCARTVRAAGTRCVRVVHRFNALGDLVATVVVTD